MNQKLLIICIFFCNALVALGDTRRSQEPLLPETNVYGTLNNEPVNYITIKNLYKHSPFYHMPSKADGDPHNSTTFIDLVSFGNSVRVKSIELAKEVSLDGSAQKGPEFVINGIKYYAVIAHFCTCNTDEETSLTLLLEADCVIKCYKKSISTEWQLTVPELQSLIIEGYREKDTKSKPCNKTKDTSSESFNETEK